MIPNIISMIFEYIKVNHIKEKTSAHGIVFDNTITLPASTLMSDIAKITWDIAPASDHTCTGNIASLTAGEALTYGQCCYLKSDGKWYKSDGGFDWFCLPIFGTWIAG